MKTLIQREILQVLADLPEMCATRRLTDGSPILIKRGTVGYWPLRDDFDVDAFNARHGITPAQVEAMMTGSMFGFDCPGADPLNFTEAA